MSCVLEQAQDLKARISIPFLPVFAVAKKKCYNYEYKDHQTTDDREKNYSNDTGAVMVV